MQFDNNYYLDFDEEIYDTYQMRIEIKKKAVRFSWKKVPTAPWKDQKES